MTELEDLSTIVELREHIHQVLCAQENLLGDQFQLLEIPLTRNGLPCGVQYVLQGPRQVRLSAVWASDRNQVFYYDAAGERFRKDVLSNPIPHAMPEARAA